MCASQGGLGMRTWRGVNLRPRRNSVRKTFDQKTNKQTYIQTRTSEGEGSGDTERKEKVETLLSGNHGT